MSNLAFDWTKPQRQSPSALIILLYKALMDVVKFVWPLLLLILFRGKRHGVDATEIIALVVSILSLSRSALEYFNFRFSLVNDELIIKKGFFTKKNITLPLEKIQAVHIEQTWLHNLFNVSRLSFDSAGSEKMEVKIEALDKHISSALRKLILESKTETVSNENTTSLPKEEILITLSGKDLFKLSLSANHLEAFFILLAFFYSSMQSIGISDKEYNGVLKWLYTTVQSDTFKLLLLLALFVMIVSVAISVIRIMLTYFEFIIARSSKGFRIGTGLINKKEKFVPFKKVQFISWRANWIRQKIGLLLLQFHATGADHLENKIQVKVPITRSAFIPVLLENYHPLLPVDNILPVKIHKAYTWRRSLIFGVIPALAALPVLYRYFNASAFFVLSIVFIVWISCWLFQQKFRLWLGNEALQIRKGIFGRHEIILKWNKIQSVHLRQNLYQQKHALATVELYTAGGTIVVPYILIQRARQIQNYSLYKIESDAELWS